MATTNVDATNGVSFQPIEVAVIVRGGKASRKVAKTQRALDKLIAGLDEKYGSGAYEIRTRAL